MTLVDVRKLLLRECKQYRGRSGLGLSGWCKARRLKVAMVSHFLSGKHGPSIGILNALGLEWRIMRKPKRAVSKKRRARR